MKTRKAASTLVLAILLTLLSVMPSSALTAPAGIIEQSTSPAGASLNSASARITWPVVNGAVAYSVIARGGGDSIPGSPAACNANECVSLLANLTGGVDYAVSIVAVDSNGNTSESLPISHRAISSPDVPTRLSVAAGSGSLTFTWLEPANLGGLPILGYQIVSPTNTITTLSATVSSFTANGLNNGTSYVYSIRARNANGFSSTLAFSPATPVGVPATPGRPSVSTSSGSVTTNWSAPASGGSEITGYTVRLLRNGVVASSVVLGPAARSHAFTGLTDGNYSVVLIATNQLGNSDPSTPSITVTLGSPQQSQQINFAQIADQSFSAGSLQLSVSATSNLPVALSHSGACTVSSLTQVVTFISTGTCTITASQSGGSGFLPAAAAVRTFQIVDSPANQSTPGSGVALTPLVSSFTTLSNLISSSATVSISGANLNAVTSVLLGSVPGRIAQQSDASLTVTFNPIQSGTYSLVVVSGSLRQTFSNAVVVRQFADSSTSSATSSSSSVSQETSGQKITIGTFKGFVAIFFKGYEGTRVSIKIAGRWIVVPRIPEDFYRVTRKTGAGFKVKAEVFIDRKLVEEKLLTTR